MNAPHETPGGLHLADRTAPHRWADANQQWLVQAIALLRQRIASQDRAGTADAQPLNDLSAQSLADPLAPREAKQPALLRCSEVFGLSAFETELLLLAAGLELDQALRDALAGTGTGTGTTAAARASFGLGLSVLTEPHWDAISPDAALRHWLLLEPESGTPLIDAPLRLDERVLHFIAGVPASDLRLRGFARYVDTQAPPPGGATAALVARAAAALQTPASRGLVVALHHAGLDAVAMRDAALAVAAALERPALWVGCTELPTEPSELAQLARRIDREVALVNALPVLAGDAAAHGGALALATCLRGPLVWLGAPEPRLAAMAPARRVLRLELPLQGAQAPAGRLQQWLQTLQASQHAQAGVIASELQRAGQQFQLGPQAVESLLEQITPLQDLHCSAEECRSTLWAAAREAARGGLDSLAQRIDSRASFASLVLPPAQMTALRDIARQLQHREQVYGDWGFGHTHARGQGLTALFAGESGTGKTLAAEAIANEVGLDLYRVDLATLVSKYIGETEKNLKRLFDAAEAGGAVLLFDEADALFGKRSEVKDSHDRYANIEVAYLLQRVEAYRGLAVLTTNMKSALDRAFLRRIRFVVTFPFPDAAAREQLWRRQFPAQAPLGTVDWAALARLHVAGGNIRSIALNAAFKAADGSGCIEQATLLEAARAEFAKLERSFNEHAGVGT